MIVFQMTVLMQGLTSTMLSTGGVFVYWIQVVWIGYRRAEDPIEFRLDFMKETSELFNR